MSELKPLMKQEAIERMKLLKLNYHVIQEFKNEGKLNLTEGFAALFWLDDEEKEMVKEFEKRTGNMVYHVIKNHTKFGLMYSLLYVSREAECWKLDRDDINQNIPYVYVVNADHPEWSEYGGIGIKKVLSAVVRTA